MGVLGAPVPKSTISSVSSSTSATVAVWWVPAAYPVGSVPNPICTLSPPSTSESSMALTLNVRLLPVVQNVTLDGSPS